MSFLLLIMRNFTLHLKQEFMAFSKTFKAVQKVKLLEAFIEGVKPNGADNDIDN